MPTPLLSTKKNTRVTSKHSEDVNGGVGEETTSEEVTTSEEETTSELEQVKVWKVHEKKLKYTNTQELINDPEAAGLDYLHGRFILEKLASEDLSCAKGLLKAYKLNWFDKAPRLSHQEAETRKEQCRKKAAEDKEVSATWIRLLATLLLSLLLPSPLLPSPPLTSPHLSSRLLSSPNLPPSAKRRSKPKPTTKI